MWAPSRHCSIVLDCQERRSNSSDDREVERRRIRGSIQSHYRWSNVDGRARSPCSGLPTRSLGRRTAPGRTGARSSSRWPTTSPNCTRNAQNPVPLPSGRQPGPLPRALARGASSMRLESGVRKALFCEYLVRRSFLMGQRRLSLGPAEAGCLCPDGPKCQRLVFVHGDRARCNPGAAKLWLYRTGRTGSERTPSDMPRLAASSGPYIRWVQAISRLR